MKIKFTNSINHDADVTTYILVGCIVVTILLGALKIIFF